MGGGDGDGYQFGAEGAYGKLMLSARELLALVGYACENGSPHYIQGGCNF